MNIGLWISFPLSTGRCRRWIVPLAVGGDAPPPCAILAGAADDATKHLPNSIAQCP